MDGQIAVDFVHWEQHPILCTLELDFQVFCSERVTRTLSLFVDTFRFFSMLRPLLSSFAVLSLKATPTATGSETMPKFRFTSSLCRASSAKTSSSMFTALVAVAIVRNHPPAEKIPAQTLKFQLFFSNHTYNNAHI